jgi:hypothetical protein
MRSVSSDGNGKEDISRAFIRMAAGRPAQPKRTNTPNTPGHRCDSPGRTYDARVKTQITGFTLKGWGATTTSGEVPVVGGPGGVTRHAGPVHVAGPVTR